MDSGFAFGRSAFYFVRHGETYENRNGIVQGQSESQLTDAGRRSAEILGLKLRARKLGSIFSSPLERAWITASIISKLTDTPVRALPGLKERYWGIYQGRPKTARPNTRNPESVETLEDFSSRVMAAFRSMEGVPPILVVSHSGVFRVLLQQIGLQVNGTSAIASTQLVRIEPPTSLQAAWRVSEVRL